MNRIRAPQTVTGDSISRYTAGGFRRPPMNCNRRRFLKQSAQALVAASAFSSRASAAPGEGRPAAAGELPQMPIVDTHQHLWDLDRFRLAWLKPGEPLTRSHLPEHYREATRGLNVVRAVYMEVDVSEEQEVAEAEYIVDLCRGGQWPTCAAVIGGRPGQEGFGDYLRRFQGNAFVKGVRQVLFRPQAEPPFFLEPAFVGGVRLLGELGMSFDLCPAATMLGAGSKLVDQCPETRFILDHCGNADVKVFQAAALARLTSLHASGWNSGGGILPRWRNGRTSSARFRALSPPFRPPAGARPTWRRL